MKLSELLEFISVLANKRGLSEPFIVGGVPRDKLLNRSNDLSDIDITTGDEGVHYLASEAASLLKSSSTSYKMMPDGHARITMGNLKLDFSSNFKVPGIKKYLAERGVEVTSMHEELFSRDFTCNTALMTMDLKKIIDPTGMAVDAISDKTIETCLPPRITFGYDKNRVIRAIYLAVKLGFEIGDKSKQWITKNADIVGEVKPKYIADKFGKAAEYDKNRLVSHLDKLGIWKHLPNISALHEAVGQSPERV